MIRFAQIAIAAGALVAAVPAQAADFLIDTMSAKANGSGNGNAINYSVASSDGKSTLNVKATAWSHNYPGNTYSTAAIAQFDPWGLGIYQSKEVDARGLHQIDNANGWEYVVLQFDQAVSLQSVKLTAFQLGNNGYVDADAFVAWGNLANGASVTGDFLKGLETGKNSFNSNSNDYAATTSVYGNASDFSLRGEQVQNYNLSPSKAGNVWIIGGSYNGPDGYADAFKLNQVKVTSGVPEPMTWMTMILGFGVVGAALRRRRDVMKAQAA